MLRIILDKVFGGRGVDLKMLRIILDKVFGGRGSLKIVLKKYFHTII